MGRILEGETIEGGVLDPDGSCIVVEGPDPRFVVSGDNEGGVGWGIDVSKSSARSTLEYVRFASSAVSCERMQRLRIDEKSTTYFSENVIRHLQGAALLLMELMGRLRRAGG